MIKLIYNPRGGYMHVYTMKDLDDHKKIGWTEVEVPAVESSVPPKEARSEAKTEVKTCPQCGKELGKRPDAHMRFCKGVKLEHSE